MFFPVKVYYADENYFWYVSLSIFWDSYTPLQMVLVTDGAASGFRNDIHGIQAHRDTKNGTWDI